MTSQPLLKINLVSLGLIIPRLYYGSNLQHWWFPHGEKNLENNSPSISIESSETKRRCTTIPRDDETAKNDLERNEYR